MTLKPEEMQRARSPTELAAFVESVHERARDDPELRRAGHMRSGCLKEFFDEVSPLAMFASSIYPEDYKVTPILGNQGYDAEVRDATGRLIERVEIANPIDGAASALDRQSVAKNGLGGVRVGDPGDDIEELLPIIEQTAKKKAMRDYSDCSLVFNVSGLPAFEGFEPRFNSQVARIREILSGVGLKARRVFLLLPSGVALQIDQST